MKVKRRRAMGHQYRPVIVDVSGELFEIHLGRPGRPRVYRRIGGGVRRVADDDPVLAQVARELRAGVDRRKAAEEAQETRRRGWKYRLMRWLGRVWARIQTARANPTGQRR